jgi:uncharacterized membrane protein
MESVLQILIPIALLSVVVTLALGFYALYRGGDFGRAWSNKLMRVRIGLQALTALLLVIFVVMRSHH